MAKRKAQSKKIDPAEKNRRRLHRTLQAMFLNAGFSRIDSEGTDIVLADGQSDFDNIFYFLESTI